MAQHMTSTGLQSKLGPVQPTSQSKRCSCSHSSPWTQSPSTKHWGMEAAKHPREDPLTGQSRWRRKHSHSRHRNEPQWYWSPSLQHPVVETIHHRPGRHSFPSPRPLQSHPTNEQLSHFLGDLHLHPWPWESWSRAQRGGAPMHTEGCPPPQQEPMDECPPKEPVKKWVRFNLDDDLSDDPHCP